MNGSDIHDVVINKAATSFDYEAGQVDLPKELDHVLAYDFNSTKQTRASLRAQIHLP